MLNKLIAGSVPFLPEKLVWQFSKRYIAGKSIEDALAISSEIVNNGMRITVDLLGECITELNQASENTKTYLQTIKMFSQANLASSFSLKPTSFGLLLDEEACYQNIRKIVASAFKHHAFVRIDMEDSTCTDMELTLFKRLHKEFPQHVALVFQAYLKRTLPDIKHIIAENKTHFALNIRLCKGIYAEAEKIAFKGYDEVRAHFLEDLEYILTHKTFAAIATHDNYLVEEAIRLINKHQVSKEMYEFQMLYGVTPHLRDIIFTAGHPIRIYVPFGKDWYAYCTRRLKENPKIAHDVIKALFISK